VLVFTSYGTGVHGIGTIEVGPTSELQPLYASEFFISHTLRWISLLLTVLLALRIRCLVDATPFGKPVRSAGRDVGLLGATRSLDFVFESLPADGRLWTRAAFYIGTAVFTALSDHHDVAPGWAAALRRRSRAGGSRRPGTDAVPDLRRYLRHDRRRTMASHDAGRAGRRRHDAGPSCLADSIADVERHCHGA
jgi:hypothetical protein